MSKPEVTIIVQRRTAQVDTAGLTGGQGGRGPRTQGSEVQCLHGVRRPGAGRLFHFQNKSSIMLLHAIIHVATVK